jgi:hypothetical protein
MKLHRKLNLSVLYANYYRHLAVCLYWLIDAGGERMLMWECNYIFQTLELVSDVFM